MGKFFSMDSIYVRDDFFNEYINFTQILKFIDVLSMASTLESMMLFCLILLLAIGAIVRLSPLIADTKQVLKILCRNRMVC